MIKPATYHVALTLFLSCLLTLPSNPVLAFAYIFAGEANGVDVVAHPIGYTGTGGVLTVTVGIDPSSANAASMAIPVENACNVFNQLSPTTGNIIFDFSTIPFGYIDFESVFLHELGHSLGLAHVNAATESGLPDADHNYTKATDGVDNTFNLSAGTDGVKGSADDVRGDDVCLHYFRTSNNNPFTIAGTVDNTTYSRDVAALPFGSFFAANADRNVSTLLAVGAATEAVMQQGSFNNELQRTLTHDDVAGIRYAAAGADEIAGTADDYTLVVSYVGLTTSADIVVDFDNTETGFAVSKSSGAFINGTHVRITGNNIFFNTGWDWYYNPALTVLDVTWDHVSVSAQAEDAIIHWSTSAEVNNDYFEVERSIDGNSWVVAGRIDPDIVHENGNSYQLMDQGAKSVANQLYYRVKQVDMDGKSSYSPTRQLAFTVDQSGQVKLGPVPVVRSTMVEATLIKMQSVDISIIDLQGRELRTWREEGIPGVNRWSVGSKILTLPNGTYLIKVTGADFEQSVKFTF